MPLPFKVSGKSPANKMAKNITKYTFVMCLLAIVVIFAFYQIKSRNSKSVGNASPTEISKLIEKDLETAYPGTPAEVMKLFGRFNKCVYNTTGIDDEEYGKLIEKMRMMFSKKLLEANPIESHMATLKVETEQFANDKKRIINYTVEKSSSIQYKEINGEECAYVRVEYFMSESRDFVRTHMAYILVNEDGKWKILAFKQMPPETKNNEEENAEDGDSSEK